MKNDKDNGFLFLVTAQVLFAIVFLFWTSPAYSQQNVTYHGHVIEFNEYQKEVVCLAKNIYFEAGNQPVAGKVAVAQVVQNRVKHPDYPDNICDVVYQARWKENWKGNLVPVRHMCQFSWFCDGKSDKPVDSATWVFSLLTAERVLQGEFGDITEEATHYHADSVHPYWADSLNETVVINNHLFYK